jgi:hypothetical protein
VIAISLLKTLNLDIRGSSGCEAEPFITWRTVVFDPQRLGSWWAELDVAQTTLFRQKPPRS